MEVTMSLIELKDPYGYARTAYKALTGCTLDQAKYEAKRSMYDIEYSAEGIEDRKNAWINKNKLKAKLRSTWEFFHCKGKISWEDAMNRYVKRNFFIENLVQNLESPVGNFIQKFRDIKDKNVSEIINNKEIRDIIKFNKGEEDTEKFLKSLAQSKETVGEFLNSSEMKDNMRAYFLNTRDFRERAKAASFIILDSPNQVDVFEEKDYVPQEFYNLLKAVANKFNRKDLFEKLEKKEKEQTRMRDLIMQNGKRRVD